jgi:dsDNA-specific endonuclease/ATPase MutS2
MDGHALGQQAQPLFAELRLVNETLWDIEDAIRACEQRKEFSSDFVRLARSVYLNNDRRAAIKRQINTITDSPLQEEKGYSEY